MKLFTIIILAGLASSKDFFDMDQSETVEITQGGQAKIRINIKISIGMTYIPVDFEPSLEIHNLLGTLVPGRDGPDYQFFDIYCTSLCQVGDLIKFRLMQTQGSHLSGHVLHAVMVNVVEDINS
jgi:hypothetical protein